MKNEGTSNEVIALLSHCLGCEGAIKWQVGEEIYEIVGIIGELFDDPLWKLMGVPKADVWIFCDNEYRFLGNASPRERRIVKRKRHVR